MKSFYGIDYEEFKENIYAFLKSYFEIKKIIFDLKPLEKEKIQELHTYNNFFLNTALINVYENIQNKEFVFIIQPDNYNQTHAIVAKDELSREQLQKIYDLLFILTQAKKDFSSVYIKYFLEYLYFNFEIKTFEGITENMQKLLDFFYDKMEHVFDDYTL
ncbi:hypothetical protein Marpi_2124 (plasmid) [Marinitoga piezophila KA3]|uniref:Uncharacterized protein n=1 Tax=Marinitoga piezophila (strain DSM 14283 / JCM 11233 / KA3) TaxID=443254 RepID=H2J8G6_MARPK|nr:hypothetical protein [Marinitoga piezophila]AEX86497.1 hypothetical protein Marpi_2124 [Marinitoga piezophila KA3]